MTFLLPEKKLSPVPMNGFPNLTSPERSMSRLHSVKYYLVHQFELEDFSRFDLLENFPVVYSGIFEPTRNPNLKFQIKFFPKGDSEKAKDYISAYLVFISNVKKDVLVDFKFSLLDHYGNRQFTCETKTRIASGQAWGFNRFVPRFYIFNLSNGLLIRDRLNFICDLEVLSDQFVYNSSQRSSDSHLHNYQVKATQSTIDSLSSLFQNGNLSDVTLVVSEDSSEGVIAIKEIRAHKLILASRSPVFEAMLAQDCSDNRLELTIEVSIEVFEEFLRYLYSGSLETLDVYAKELVQLADKYGVEALKRVCAKVLSLQVDAQNASEYLQLADRFCIPELKRVCAANIVTPERWEKPSNSENILEMLHELSIKNQFNSPLPNNLISPENRI